VSTAVITDRLDLLASVGLAELEAAASLLTRRDRKYLAPASLLDGLLGGLGADARALQIDGRCRFRYESVYFDTPELTSFLAAARGRPRRCKVRTRTYLDSGVCHLEVKTQSRKGLTVKLRWPHPIGARGELTAGALEILRTVPELDGDPGRLVPTLRTSFVRTL